MIRNINIPLKIRILIVLLGIFTLLSFASQEHKKTICRSIAIHLNNEYDNHFIDKSDVFAMLKSETKNLIGTRMSMINLRQLEKKLSDNQYILNAQLYSTIKGTLTVYVRLKKPIARLTSRKHSDAYLAGDGTLLSLSDKFTARTMLISGHLADRLLKLTNIKQHAQGKQLLKTIQYINNNSFWKAQVAQLYFDKKNNLTIYPQVTDQKIEFGSMNNMDRKFEKLMIFYKKILPQKGWTIYDRVNVQYENQIVAQKK